MFGSGSGVNDKRTLLQSLKQRTKLVNAWQRLLTVVLLQMKMGYTGEAVLKCRQNITCVHRGSRRHNTKSSSKHAQNEAVNGRTNTDLAWSGGAANFAWFG
jgi:hypothetical protein